MLGYSFPTKEISFIEEFERARGQDTRYLSDDKEKKTAESFRHFVVEDES